MATTPRQAAADPALSVRPDTMQLSGILRADKIRHDTLVQLVQHWGVEQARLEIIDQLDALAEAVCSPREQDGELDALIQNVENAAAMDEAETLIDLYAALRLRNELTAAIVDLARFNPAAATADSSGK